MKWKQNWKQSVPHLILAAALVALVAYAHLFFFNPLWWLCLVILLAGLVGSSRMILRQHTLLQVVVGFLTGFVCAYFSVMKLSINLII